MTDLEWERQLARFTNRIEQQVEHGQDRVVVPSGLLRAVLADARMHDDAKNTVVGGVTSSNTSRNMARREKTAENPADVRRIQIRSTRQQEDLLKEAAGVANAELGPWCLAHLMAVIGKQVDGTPTLITGDVSTRLRTLASARGITPSKLLEQWLLTATDA